MKLGVSYYFVGDINKAKAMYSRFLQAEPVYADGDWVEFRLEGGAFALHLNPELQETDQSTTVKYGAIADFYMEDIQKGVSHAQEAGFRLVDEIDEQPHGKEASLRDPWGNHIDLLQPTEE